MRPFLALAFLTLLAPVASAGLFDDDPLEVRAGEPHAGTAMRFEVSDERDGARTLSTVFVLIEDPTADPQWTRRDGFLVRDRFGVEVVADAYRIDVRRDGELVHAERCYALQGAPATVKHELLSTTTRPAERDGARASAAFELAPGRPSLRSTPREVYGGEACFGRQLLRWAPYVEGMRLPLAHVMPELDQGLGLSSEPGIAAEWRGRPALSFAFDLAPAFADGSHGTLVALVGLGGVVRLDIDATLDGARVLHTRELSGYAGGDGYIPPEVDHARGAPERNPAATFVEHEPLAFHDDALQLAFPYAEALAALRADPTSDFAAWSGPASDAQLTYARYDREMRDDGFPNAPTDGGWLLLFTDAGGETRYAKVVRVHEGGLALPTQARPTRVLWMEASVPHVAFPPRETPAAASVASLAQAYGLAPGGVRALEYLLYADARGEGGAILSMSDVSSERADEETRGRTLFLDLPTGGLYGLSETTATPGAPGLLDFPSGRDDLAAVEQGSRFTPVVGPAVGENLLPYGAAATGLALLLLLLKLVALPLYTRLRRARLLDNPVRARLYDRVRAEPGIHRADLIDYAGIGEGATRHHLAQLVKHRFLVETDVDGYARYFAAGEVPPDVARREALLRAGSHRRVYELYAAEPALSLREAAERLGLSAPSVHRAKKKLEAAGLLPAARSAEAPAEA